MSSISFVVVIRDDRLTKLLQCADVFEPSKVIGRVVTMSGEMKPGNTIKTVFEKTAKALSDSGNTPIAMFVPGNREGAWRDNNVNVVSTGASWSLFDSVLASNGYPLDTGAESEGPST